jgi:hypothetical protein
VDNVVAPVANVVTGTIDKAMNDPVGTIAMVATAIVAPELLPLVSGANTLAHGGSVGDALTSAATAYVGGQVAAGVGTLGDQVAAAATYGTDLGSAQTAALAAQDAGMGTIGDVAGNIAGGVARTAVTGGDPLAALVSGGVGAGVNELSAQVPGFNDLPAAAQTAVKTAMSAELQGKDPSSALINQALNAGINAAKDYSTTTPTGNLPTTTGANTPSTDFTSNVNYGLSTGIDPTSGLTPPMAAGNTNADGSTNYDLANPTISSGLTQPIAPTLSDMGGGYGFITPVTGGYMTSLGFVPQGSSSVLGDPSSFINDPNVLGKTVIGADTLRAPLTGVAATPASSAVKVGALPTSGSSAATTGGLAAAGASAPSGLSVTDPTAPAGGYKTVGKMGGDMTEAGLKQLYASLTGAPAMTYAAPTLAAPTERTLAQLEGQSPYYAHGGSVQHFAEGDTVSSENLATGLKALGNLDSGLKQPQHNLRQVGQAGMAYSPKATPTVMPQLAALLRSRGMTLADGGQPDDHKHPNYDGTPVFRTGGLDGLGGKYVEGKGDGTSDDISAMLANGEYVFSADVVSALGNGSNKAGADKLGEMVEAIRARARSAPPDKLPPDAKSPLEYLKSPKGKKHG